jgi:hypothetical protein
MKTIVTGLLVGSLILGAVSFACAGGPFLDREARQQARIRQGLHTGALTPHEYHALQHEQAAIDRCRQRAWADGRLNPREAERLHRMQDRAGHHIYGAKHNVYWR